MPPKIALPPPSLKIEKKEKGKSKGKRKHKINLKGWLKTPADWERFEAWAKVNAQPRKILEPEPIVRQTRPLSQMKKRIQILSQPAKKTDASAICRLDLSVSQAALKAKPSKRIKKLAKFVLREAARCREFPIKIRKATLLYEPSARIIEISRPFIRVSEECKTLEISKKALKHNTTARERLLALTKKSIECPDSLTDEERNEIMTPTGIMKSALTYKFSPWMSLLSLPSYRYLKDRKDENAEAWKKQIIEESQTRGKKALEENLKKEQKEKEKKKKKTGQTGEETKDENDEAKVKERTEFEGEKTGVEEKEDKTEGEDAGTQEEQTESQDGETTEDHEIAKENKEEEKKLQEKKAKQGRKRKKKAKGESGDTSDEDHEAKRRKLERNAWRFTPSSCKEVGVKKSALKGKVPPGVDKLSKPNIRKDQACRENPFGVRKSALLASASSRITEMAKPTNPRDPVERPPPREKDDFGRKIFPMPNYGKVLPEIKYKEAECKTDNEEKKPKKKKSLHPIAFEPSIDPCVDPQRAKRQQKERKKLAKTKNKSSGDGG